MHISYIFYLPCNIKKVVLKRELKTSKNTQRVWDNITLFIIETLASKLVKYEIDDTNVREFNCFEKKVIVLEQDNIV